MIQRIMSCCIWKRKCGEIFHMIQVCGGHSGECCFCTSSSSSCELWPPTRTNHFAHCYFFCLFGVFAVFGQHLLVKTWPFRAQLHTEFPQLWPSFPCSLAFVFGAHWPLKVTSESFSLLFPADLSLPLITCSQAGVSSPVNLCDIYSTSSVFKS